MVYGTPQAQTEEEEKAGKAKQENITLWQEMWQMLREDKSITGIREFLDKDARFSALPPEDKKDIHEFVTVLDKKASPEERLKAAMNISQKDAKADGCAERFLDQMFKHFSADGNLENDREQIKKIETALNGLEVNGVKLQVDVDGRADGRLASLLRTPEVIAALKRNMETGMVQDIAFKDDFDTKNADLVRLRKESQPQTPAR